MEAKRDAQTLPVASEIRFNFLSHSLFSDPSLNRRDSFDTPVMADDFFPTVPTASSPGGGRGGVPLPSSEGADMRGKDNFPRPSCQSSMTG